MYSAICGCFAEFYFRPLQHIRAGFVPFILVLSIRRQSQDNFYSIELTILLKQVPVCGYRTSSHTLAVAVFAVDQASNDGIMLVFRLSLPHPIGSSSTVLWRNRQERLMGVLLAM
jgi:hypothetical protein